MSYIINIKTLDLDEVRISNPQKIDNILHSKIKYSNEKCIIKFENCKLIQIKKGESSIYYFYIKLDKENTRMYSLLEEHIISKIIAKVHYWNNMNVQDGFKKNMVIDSKYGSILLIKSIKNYEEYIGKNIDLYLRPNMIKCVNKTIYINWQIADIIKNDTELFVEQDDIDENDSNEADDANVLGPYKDDLEVLMKKMTTKIDALIGLLNYYKENANTNEQDITEIYEALQKYINKNMA